MQMSGALEQAPDAAGPHLNARQIKVRFDDVHDRPTPQGQYPFCAGRGCASPRGHHHLLLMRPRRGPKYPG